LAHYVLTASKDLGRIHNINGILKTIADITKKNDYLIKLFRQRTQPEISEEDFVVTVWGALGQIKKVIKSKYGYKAFRIKHLEQPPLPDTKIDDYPAENIRLLYKRKPLAEKVRDEISKVSPGLKPSTRWLNKSIEEMVLHLWNNVGLKEFTLNNPDAGYEKIQQEIDRIKVLDRHDHMPRT